MNIKLLKKLRKRFMWYYEQDNFNDKYIFKYRSIWHIWDKKYDEYHRIENDDTKALIHMIGAISHSLIDIAFKRNCKRLENKQKIFRDEIKQQQKVRFLKKFI